LSSIPEKSSYHPKLAILKVSLASARQGGSARPGRILQAVTDDLGERFQRGIVPSGEAVNS
ncbi:MAG: hypothetical protein QGG54_02690, partial [Gammaproteobacteria bacterium]|nr:hypothetical protein [Gammaproteobacteria bacterium]